MDKRGEPETASGPASAMVHARPGPVAAWYGLFDRQKFLHLADNILGRGTRNSESTYYSNS